MQKAKVMTNTLESTNVQVNWQTIEQSANTYTLIGQILNKSNQYAEITRRIKLVWTWFGKFERAKYLTNEFLHSNVKPGHSTKKNMDMITKAQSYEKMLDIRLTDIKGGLQHEILKIFKLLILQE